MLSEIWSDVRYRLRALFDRDALERELDAELRFHLEREAERLERAGLSRDDAMRRARAEFGRVDRVKEASRRARGTVALESVLHDLRISVRALSASRGFTLGVVLTFALGIGVNTTMFGVVDRLLLRPPPFLRDVPRVHRVYMKSVRDGVERTHDATSIARYLDLQRGNHTLSSLVAFDTWHVAVGEGEATRELPVAAVSGGFFALFDARPALGRFITPQDDRMPTGTPVVVLGDAYWRAALGARRDVLGRQLRVGRMLFTVVGVAPPGFVGLGDGEVPAMYTPLAAFAWNARPEDHTRDYHWQWPQLLATRAPGVDVATAQADLTAALARSWLARNAVEPSGASPVQAARPRVILGPVQASRGPAAGPESKVALWVSGVAVVVLLVACANVANLLLARGMARRREIALRLAIGVSRGRLVRHLVTESALLAAAGGVVALVVARWGGTAVRALFLPNDLSGPGLGDGRTLLATLAATAAAALAAGLAPALQALRSDVSDALRAGGRDADARPSRARAVLLVFQATLSVVLLVGAGLFVRSLHNVQRVRLGFDVEPVLVVSEFMRGVQLSVPERVRLEQRLVDAARAIPGVVSASPAPTVPFWGFEGRPLFVAGIDSVSRLGDFTLQAGNADYFRTLGTRIVRGRAFAATDDRADGPPVTIVSAGMARALWPGRDPIGRCVRIGADTAPCATVIGVAEDIRLDSFNDPREYSYYVPIAQYDFGAAGMALVRLSGEAAGRAESVRRALQRVMPGDAYVTVVPMREMVAPRMRSWRVGATMFVALGGLALAIAGIGLYGLIAYGVAQRRREIGVRVALGASRAHVLALVARGPVRLVAAGVVLGGAIALGVARGVTGLLFRESPADPLVYAAVALVLLAVSLVAAAVPARAASRVEPTIALRSD
ncbi:permease [Gemmatirosa kalamazoonensis]|uniref:Permease n=1 Tax=Gemmatirosa kalamazoonensis TaxID=861299 RepID=W0RK09_9BACT|nr:ADOP family duplicated permease [Gemmatirosa kalamazoonensis]AHG89733.1 permease [Gemmatirosa kalamazoonensis]